MRQVIATVGLLWASTVYAQQPSRAQIRLVDQQTHNKYLAHLPSSADGVLDKIKGREDVVFYDSTVMPRAYEDRHGALHGVVPISHNISADRSEPFGNPRDFPWAAPAGTDNSDNARTFKFLLLPDGQRITAWRQRLAGDNDPRGTHCWAFPVGTTFGEVLLVNNPRTGASYTYEVRLRTKLTESGLDGWSVNAYRPFVSPEQLVERVRELRSSIVEYDRLVDGLRRPRLRRLALRDRHDFAALIVPPAQAAAVDVSVFDRSGLEEKLAPVDDDLVVDLLTKTSFRSALGKEWRTEGGESAHAPSTDADFHIVPRNYAAYMVAVDKKSCQGCHESAQKKASDFQPFRNWYGAVSGSGYDGILSFTLFDPSCYSRGFELPVTFRRELQSVIDWKGQR